MTKQSENGSEVTAPQTNISASESGVSSEVKTPENKPSEGCSNPQSTTARNNSGFNTKSRKFDV